MALPGHLLKVFLRTDTTTPISPNDEITGMNDIASEIMKDILETTDFKDTSGAKLRMTGLEDHSHTPAGDLLTSDTVFGTIRTAFDAGNTCYLTIYWDPSASAGNKGYRFPVLLEKWSPKASVGGKVEVSFQFVGNGSKLAV